MTSFRLASVSCALTLTLLACASTDEASAPDQEQDLTASQTACQADVECVGVETLPCCSSQQEAFNKSSQAEAERKAEEMHQAAAALAARSTA